MVVVGIGHRAQQGKDTLCNLIIKNFGLQFDIRRYAFADQLKLELFSLLGNPQDEFWKFAEYPGSLELCVSGIDGDVAKLQFIENYKRLLRPLLQVLGEYRRSSDSFYWIKSLRKKLLSDNPQMAIITDLRYKNEFFFLKSFDGVTVKVTRTGYLDPSIDYSHPSETELLNAKFDYEIDCMNGDLVSLEQDAIALFGMIKESCDPHVVEAFLEGKLVYAN